MGFLGVGRCLKSFLEVVRFFVTEYRVVGSHGDPIRDRNHGFALLEAIRPPSLKQSAPPPGGVSQAQWEGLGRDNLTRLEDPMGRRIWLMISRIISTASYKAKPSSFSVRRRS